MLGSMDDDKKEKAINSDLISEMGSQLLGVGGPPHLLTGGPSYAGGMGDFYTP